MTPALGTRPMVGLMPIRSCADAGFWIEPSVSLDLLKSGVGLSLVRDSIAIRESHAHGLTLARQVQLPCTLRVVALRQRLSEPVLMSAWGAIKRAWSLSRGHRSGRTTSAPIPERRPSRPQRGGHRRQTLSSATGPASNRRPYSFHAAQASGRPEAHG